MKNAQEKNEDIVFIIKAGEIEEIDYIDYLWTYCSDQTTSPNGVEPRMHLRCSDCGRHENFYREKSKCDNCGSEFCEVWSWGTGGNNPYCISRGISWKEGCQTIMDAMESYAAEDDQHSFYSTREEAEERLAEMEPEERAKFYSV